MVTVTVRRVRPRPAPPSIPVKVWFSILRLLATIAQPFVLVASFGNTLRWKVQLAMIGIFTAIFAPFVKLVHVANPYRYFWPKKEPEPVAKYQAWNERRQQYPPWSPTHAKAQRNARIDLINALRTRPNPEMPTYAEPRPPPPPADRFLDRLNDYLYDKFGPRFFEPPPGPPIVCTYGPGFHPAPPRPPPRLPRSAYIDTKPAGVPSTYEPSPPWARPLPPLLAPLSTSATGVGLSAKSTLRGSVLGATASGSSWRRTGLRPTTVLQEAPKPTGSLVVIGGFLRGGRFDHEPWSRNSLRRELVRQRLERQARLQDSAEIKTNESRGLGGDLSVLDRSEIGLAISFNLSRRRAARQASKSQVSKSQAPRVPLVVGVRAEQDPAYLYDGDGDVVMGECEVLEAADLGITKTVGNDSQETSEEESQESEEELEEESGGSEEEEEEEEEGSESEPESEDSEHSEVCKDSKESSDELEAVSEEVSVSENETVGMAREMPVPKLILTWDEYVDDDGNVIEEEIDEYPFEPQEPDLLSPFWSSSESEA